MRRLNIILLVCMLFMAVGTVMTVSASTYSVRLDPSSPSAGEPVTCILNIDGYDITSLQDKAWFYYQWRKNGAIQNQYSDFASDVLPSGVTNEGEYWQCQILFDGAVQGQSPNTLIGEEPYEPPSGPKNARIEPSTPYENDGLTCILNINGYDITDPQDKIWFYYQWLKNGAVQSSYSGFGDDVIPSNVINTGETWKCKILFDGTVQTQSPTVTVQPKPVEHNPTISLSLTPSSPAISDDITCTATVGDVDGSGHDLNKVVFKWYKNGAYISGSEETVNVNGQSATVSDTLSGGQTGYTDVIKCEAVIHDDTGRTASANKQVTVETAPTLQSISISPKTSQIQVHETQSYTVTAHYSDSSTADVTSSATFTSSNTGIANEISHAVFKGLNIGTVTITASYQGKTDAATLQVNAPSKVLDRIEIDPTSSTIDIGAFQSYTVTAYYTDIYYSPEVVTSSTTFTSSNTGIANEISHAVFKALSSGTVTITASYQGETAQATLVVNTEAKTLESIEISPPNPTIVVGQTKQFTIKAHYSDNSEADVTSSTTCWSQATHIADQTSNNCEFIGISAGSATIAARYIEGTTQITGTVLTVVTTSNTPPTIDHIPGQTIEVGQTINPAIDLHNYADDNEDPDTDLTYSITQSDTSVIFCYITQSGGYDRYIACNNAIKVGYNDITLTVSDTGGLTASDTFRITVTSATVEHNPSIDTISISPSSPDTNNDLTCSVTVSDVDGSGHDLNHVVFRWYRGSSTLKTETLTVSGSSDSAASNLPHTATNPGDAIGCEATVHDDTGRTDSDSTTVNIESISGDNNPIINSMSLTPSSPTTNQDLTCSVSVSDMDGSGHDLNHVEFKWYRGSTLITTDTKTVSGSSDSASDVLSSSQTNEEDTIKCEAVVYDDDSNTDTEQRTVTVQTTPTEHDPVINSMSLTPSSPTTNQDLTCSVSVSDVDGNLDHVQFKWYVEDMNNPVKTIDKTVSGSSSSASDVLSHTYTDYDDEVKCKARVYDAGSRNVASSRTVTVQSEPTTNKPPAISGIPDKSVQIGNTISQIDLYNFANDNEDSDSALTYIITSETNIGVIDCSISGDRYVVCGNGLSVGHSDITVKVIDTGALFDTDAFRITVTSAPVENDPVIETLEVTPSSPSTDDNIECTVLASDDDGDLDRAVFKWYKNGQQVGSAITKTLSGYLDTDSVTLSSSSTSPEDVIRCDVTVYDDNSNTDSDSESVTVQSLPSDHAPYIDSLMIYPQNPSPQNDLTCRVSANDVDGDLNRVEFKWYRNGVQIGSTDTKTLSGYYDYETDDLSSSYTTEGDLIQCKTIVYDDNSNSVMWTTSVIIGYEPLPQENSPVAYADIVPQNPTTSQTITCSGIAEDVDNNLDHMVFEWTIPNRLGSTVIKSTTKSVFGGFDAEQDTLSSSYTQEGDLVNCKVTAYDDTGLYGIDSVSVYVQTTQPSNQPPIAVFYAYPTSIYEGDQVFFDADGSYDTDGNVTSYYFDFGDGSNSEWTSSDHIYHTYNMQNTYNARVKVRDNEGLESAWSSTILIVVSRETEPPVGDHDPIIDNIYIRPPDPEENDDLECHVSAYDSDGDIDRIVIRWYVDGSQKKTRTLYDSGSRATVSDTLDEQYTNYDDAVRCVATVYDDGGNTDEESYTVIIGDYYTPPYYPPCDYPPCHPPCPTCPTGTCGVSITSLDFSRNTNANKLSWAEVGVLNTGSRSANLELKVTVDGSVKGIHRVQIPAGSEIDKHFDFGLEQGSHSLNVEAKMDCGSTDSETGTIYVGETTPGFVPGEEYVEIYPRDIQMDAFSTSQIYVEMNSPSEQTFTISVGGMDESWLHYDNDVEVRGKRTEKVILTPKKAGTYNLNVVVSSESGKTFRKDVKVYVNDYEEDAARRFLPLASGAAGAATLTGNYIVTGLSLWGAGNILMSLIALILLILIIYLLYRRRRSDEDYNEQPGYSQEVAEVAEADRRYFSNYPYNYGQGKTEQHY